MKYNIQILVLAVLEPERFVDLPVGTVVLNKYLFIKGELRISHILSFAQARTSYMKYSTLHTSFYLQKVSC